MPAYIEMPKLSDTMTEGTLVKWRKKPGDKVEAGDIIAEVETDKATMEMEAFDDGILGEIYVQEGEKIAVGEQIAVLLAEGEEAPARGGAKAPGSPKPSEIAAPAKTNDTPAQSPGNVKSAPASSGGRIKASPLAKKIAAEKGVDLSGLTGSGPGR